MTDELPELSNDDFASAIPARVRRRLALRIGVSAICLVGCATTNATLRKTAALELTCPADNLAITSLQKSYYVVSGCAQHATYRCVHDGSGKTRFCQRVDRRQPAAPAVSQPVDRPPPAALAVEQREQRVREKASRVLACETESLALASTAPGYYRAEGCGRTIDYECLSHAEDCCAFEEGRVEAREAVKRAAALRSDKGLAGTLSKQSILDAMQTSEPAVRECFEVALRKSPSVAGVASIEFVIEPDGHVQTAAVARSSVGKEDVESCLLEVVRGLRFDLPRGGGIVLVTYPYVLQNPSPHSACR